jgi:hypothetical protein
VTDHFGTAPFNGNERTVRAKKLWDQCGQ